MGTVWETPSPESMTIPVVRPEAYKDKTAWMATYMAGGVEGLEHDLSHLLTVGLGVKRGLGQKNGVLLRGNTELIVEGVVPDLLHIVPVGDNTVLDGVLQGEDTSLGLGLISNERVLGVHTDHDTGVAGDVRQWRGRRHGGRHHQRIRLCTYRIHCPQQGLELRRRTSLIFGNVSNQAAERDRGKKPLIGWHNSQSNGREGRALFDWLFIFTKKEG